VRGRLLDRDKDGDGVVETPNGARYEFWLRDVASEDGLRFKTPVEFDLQGGRAIGIRRVAMPWSKRARFATLFGIVVVLAIASLKFGGWR